MGVQWISRIAVQGSPRAPRQAAPGGLSFRFVFLFFHNVMNGRGPLNADGPPEIERDRIRPVGRSEIWTQPVRVRVKWSQWQPEHQHVAVGSGEDQNLCMRTALLGWPIPITRGGELHFLVAGMV